MASSQITDEAFVTLATNDSYGLGALTLGHSLERAGTSRVLVCMITKHVSQTIKDHLSRIFQLVEVNILDSQDAVNLELLTRPDLGVTFTKLHCWRLTQFKKCVFLDADTLVLQNVDDLFEREELSAAADVGWPDCFNSGVFVYRPSEKTYEDLLKFALDHGSFDGGDQGLLNSFFSDWATKDIKHHLPFLYNVVAQSFYTYLPAFKRFGKDVKILHFIGANKPWMGHYHSDTGAVDCPGDLGLYCQDFLKLWWQIFTENVHFSAESLKKLTFIPTHEREHAFGGKQSMGHTEQELFSKNHQLNWEKGNVDFLGIDKFENIRKQLDIKSGRIHRYWMGVEPQQQEQVIITYVSQQPVQASSIYPPQQLQQQSNVPLSPTSTLVKREQVPLTKISVSKPIQPVATTKPPQSDLLHRQEWESGHADYMGRDSFENIQKRLDSKTKKATPKPPYFGATLSSFPRPVMPSKVLTTQAFGTTAFATPVSPTEITSTSLIAKNSDIQVHRETDNKENVIDQDTSQNGSASGRLPDVQDEFEKMFSKVKDYFATETSLEATKMVVPENRSEQLSTDQIQTLQYVVERGDEREKQKVVRPGQKQTDMEVERSQLPQQKRHHQEKKTDELVCRSSFKEATVLPEYTEYNPREIQEPEQGTQFHPKYMKIEKLTFKPDSSVLLPHVAQVKDSEVECSRDFTSEREVAPEEKVIKTVVESGIHLDSKKDKDIVKDILLGQRCDKKSDDNNVSEQRKVFITSSKDQISAIETEVSTCPKEKTYVTHETTEVYKKKVVESLPIQSSTPVVKSGAVPDSVLKTLISTEYRVPRLQDPGQKNLIFADDPVASSAQEKPLVSEMFDKPEDRVAILQKPTEFIAKSKEFPVSNVIEMESRPSVRQAGSFKIQSSVPHVKPGKVDETVSKSIISMDSKTEKCLEGIIKDDIKLEQHGHVQKFEKPIESEKSPIKIVKPSTEVKKPCDLKHETEPETILNLPSDFPICVETDPSSRMHSIEKSETYHKKIFIQEAPQDISDIRHHVESEQGKPKDRQSGTFRIQSSVSRFEPKAVDESISKSHAQSELSRVQPRGGDIESRSYGGRYTIRTRGDTPGRLITEETEDKVDKTAVKKTTDADKQTSSSKQEEYDRKHFSAEELDFINSTMRADRPKAESNISGFSDLKHKVQTGEKIPRVEVTETVHTSKLTDRPEKPGTFAIGPSVAPYEKKGDYPFASLTTSDYSEDKQKEEKETAESDDEDVEYVEEWEEVHTYITDESGKIIGEQPVSKHDISRVEYKTITSSSKSKGEAVPHSSPVSATRVPHFEEYSIEKPEFAKQETQLQEQSKKNQQRLIEQQVLQQCMQQLEDLEAKQRQLDLQIQEKKLQRQFLHEKQLQQQRQQLQQKQQQLKDQIQQQRSILDVEKSALTTDRDVLRKGGDNVTEIHYSPVEKTTTITHEVLRPVSSSGTHSYAYVPQEYKGSSAAQIHKVIVTTATATTSSTSTTLESSASGGISTHAGSTSDPATRSNKWHSGAGQQPFHDPKILQKDANAFKDADRKPHATSDFHQQQQQHGIAYKDSSQPSKVVVTTTSTTTTTVETREVFDTIVLRDTSNECAPTDFFVSNLPEKETCKLEKYSSEKENDLSVVDILYKEFFDSGTGKELNKSTDNYTGIILLPDHEPIKLSDVDLEQVIMSSRKRSLIAEISFASSKLDPTTSSASSPPMTGFQKFLSSVKKTFSIEKKDEKDNSGKATASSPEATSTTSPTSMSIASSAPPTQTLLSGVTSIDIKTDAPKDDQKDRKKSKK